MWLPASYFQPPGLGSPNGSIYWFEVWQDDLRTSDVIRHEPSKTFYGGTTGVVHVFRALIQIYLNCCAIRGDFKPPEDPPSAYDLSRFNVNEQDRIAGWIDDWTLAIEECIKILSRTSDERKQGLASIQSMRDDDSEVTSDDAYMPSAPSPKSSTSPTRATKSSGPSKPKASKRKSRGRKFSDYNEEEADDGDGDTDESQGPDVNYDDLDKTSTDGNSSDGEAWREFNERHLDDDIFPPEDLIGIRARYGVDPDGPAALISEAQSTSQVTENGEFADLPR